MNQRAESASRYATEVWFRSQGLPYFVDPRRQSQRLLARSASLLVFAALLTVGFSLSIRLPVFNQLESPADESSEFTALLAMLAIWMGVLLLAIIAAWVVARYFVSKVKIATICSLVSIGMIIFLSPLLLVGSPNVDWGFEFSTGVGLVLLILLLVWSGFGSIIIWSLRAAVQQLSVIWLLAAVALPLLILVIIFAFYSQETWQMVANLPRGRTFWLQLFLFSIGLLFVIYTARKELRDLPQTIDAEARNKLRGDTPLAGLTVDGEEGADSKEGWNDLSRMERINVIGVLVLAQCIQVAIFGALVFAFLMALAALSVPPNLEQLWSGKPITQLQMGIISFPVSEVQVRVCAFLAGIGVLNFVVSVTASQAYREAFYDPLIFQTSKALAVHSGYKAHFVIPDSVLTRERISSADAAKAEEKPLEKDHS